MNKLGRWFVVCCVAGSALTVGTLTASPSGAATTVTGAVLVSAPGDPIGTGTTRVFSPPTALFLGGGEFGGVDVSVYGINGTGESWLFHFVPPRGGRLLPGTYPNATQPQIGSLSPALEVTLDGNSCSTAYGSFVVNSVQFDAQGILTELDASFVQHCNSPLAPPLTGNVKYNVPPAAQVVIDATQPSIVVGEPTAFAARVAPNGTAPTGSVSFRDGGISLGTVPLGAGGIAVFSTSKLTAGAHSITASYSGDAAHPSATSSPTTQTVSASATSAWFLSGAGDLVGQGIQASYTPATAAMNLGGGRSGIQLTIATNREYWSISLTPATGQQLQPGVYANAQHTADVNHPKIDVWTEEGDCNTTIGGFSISALDIGILTGNIKRFTAVFVQRCSATDPPLIGSIRWNA